MKRVLATIVAVMLLRGASSVAAELSGRVDRVVDGDTFWLCDQTACHKIRLCGMNAPEQGEQDYQRAKQALTDMLKGKTLRCVQVGGGTPCDGRSKPVNRDRIVAQCFADDVDIGAALVATGIACDWVKFSGAAYSQGGSGRVCP